MAVKNWETVDVARLMKVENTFQDSIFVDGWGWEVSQAWHGLNDPQEQGPHRDTRMRAD